uniref:Uncharacterized protein n=1 Tax=viral metagenome TaxID=1070528 RepID=A0A6C0D0G6_9ZZZZ
MDIFCDIDYNNLACNIKENKFSESNKINKINIKSDNKKSESKYLIDEIFSKNDIEYFNADDKDLYREQLKIKIATQIDEKSDKYYDCFNYKKVFSKKIIQTGLLKINYLSSILYLIDLYKTNIVIQDIITKKYICLSSRYNKTDVYIFNNNWKYDKEININDIEYERYDKTHNYFIYDIKSMYIYNNDMNTINNYKLDDLKTLAKNKNIVISNGVKKLTKKEIYDKLYYMCI